MASEESTIQTESEALRAMLLWSKERPIWQQDALRRLTADIGDLTKICKDSSLHHEPLAERHIRVRELGSPKISLIKLRDMQNVNALVEGQSLRDGYKN